ncbi:MAG: EscU/YscU/HrcU family type III secretion system export apparatus switch protein [Syntrophales bacterium]|nr:EscU/YscU/HrcU family type III secretion system export apparatus switch protein [Syntrophales bacterium]
MKKRSEKLLAAAVAYDAQRDRAPRVVAKGRGFVAEKIIALAREHGIPIKEDPWLVQVLCRLELEEEIPSELYRAIAEILAFVYRLNEKKRENLPNN